MNFTATAPYILYWHEGSNTLQLGKWGNHITAANYQSKMLVFKFGSVVGSDLKGTTFATSNIKFNPTNITAWGSLPYWENWTGTKPTDYSTASGFISSAGYHTSANVKAGFGDPCKLVGLTVAQIQAGSYDNKAYRLPTRDENVAMAGGLANPFPPTAGKFVFTDGNPALATFPTPEPDITLPAARHRNKDGAITAQVVGSYLSSTPANANANLHLDFIATALTASHSDASAYAFAVRCVPQ